MWLTKLLSAPWRRREPDLDEEPARFPTVVHSIAPRHTSTTNGRTSLARGNSSGNLAHAARNAANNAATTSISAATAPTRPSEQNTELSLAAFQDANGAALKSQVQQQLKPKGGFDPYNSGTFKRENAWEKVTRK
jgi:hypothetical protein